MDIIIYGNKDIIKLVSIPPKNLSDNSQEALEQIKEIMTKKQEESDEL